MKLSRDTQDAVQEIKKRITEDKDRLSDGGHYHKSIGQARAIMLINEFLEESEKDL